MCNAHADFNLWMREEKGHAERGREREREEGRGTPLGRRYRGDDEFAGEQADGGQDAVGDQRQRRQRIDGGVDVRQPFQALEAAVLASAIAIPEWTMARQ